MNTTPFAIMAALSVACLFPSCATHNVPVRHVPRNPASAGQYANHLKSSAFIESNNQRKFSCSFVEFDERGDYLDFGQHQHCWKSIRRLSRDSRVLLVIYCHGWKNNSQSGDVIKFNSFLGRLANSQPVASAGLRVHGVYLSWKGGVFRSNVKREDSDRYTSRYFGQEIIDHEQQNPVPFLTFLPDQLSYWNRKGAAEHRVSGVPLSRSVFSFASVARKSRPDNIVVLMGHSFGALMIEQSVAEASVGALVKDWSWSGRGRGKVLQEALPFDLVLLVNSAAPSLYSKMLRDLADAYDQTDGRGKPLLVSLTSKADRATGALHPLANVAAPLDPTMWRRSYEQQMFELEKGERLVPPVRQSEFYRRTPGHNPYMISHQLLEDEAFALSATDRDWEHIFARNIMAPTPGNQFLTAGRSGAAPSGWRIQQLGREVPHGPGGKKYIPLRSAYWIIKCDKSLIKDHGDIWNDRAMHAYGAIFGVTRALR